MNFDNNMIRKLTEIFHDKANEMERVQCVGWREDFADLMNKIGIKQVVPGDYHCRDVGESIIGDCNRFQGCVLVFDPSEGISRKSQVGNRYLLIPKELAEKILVLGLGQWGKAA